MGWGRDGSTWSPVFRKVPPGQATGRWWARQSERDGVLQSVSFSSKQRAQDSRNRCLPSKVVLAQLLQDGMWRRGSVLEEMSLRDCKGAGRSWESYQNTKRN